MISNFTIKGNKIILKNNGEYFGTIHDFEYNIGDKLYEFAIMDNKEFEKLKAIYTQLIELVCYAKETNSEDEKYYPNDFYRDLEEDEYTTEILMLKWNEEVEKISKKKHNEYMKFFETIRDLLIENLIEKKTDLKE